MIINQKQQFQCRPFGVFWLVGRDVVSYNTAINACEHGSQWPYSLMIFESMSKATYMTRLGGFFLLS